MQECRANVINKSNNINQFLPRTSETYAQETRGKMASNERTPTHSDRKDIVFSKKLENEGSLTGRETMSQVYLVYYILKEHRECQGCIFQLVQTAMDQRFILETKTNNQTTDEVSFASARYYFI